MKPLIQIIQKLPNKPSKISVDSSDQNFAKVPIISKKIHIVSEKLRLTQFCKGSANGAVISERLDNTFICCRHLVHAFLTITDDRESLVVYKKIRERKEIDTEEFAPNETVLNNQFYDQISLSGYYANIQYFSELIEYAFNQGEINSIRKYVFSSLSHVMAMIMKKTAYNKGWIIAYDPNITFQCMIFHIENIIQTDNISPLQSTTENPWEKIKQFMHSDWKELYFSENKTMALLNFNTTYHYSNCQSFDVQCFSDLNPDIFDCMLNNGHYGCYIKDGLSKISWEFQSFGVNNLQQLKDVLLSKEGLYYAMQNGHRQSVYTFFNQLKNFCDTDPLLTSKPMDLKEIKALEEMLLAKRTSDKLPGLLKACHNRHIQIVEVFFTFIKDFSNSHPEFKKSCLKILFNVHCQYGSSLHLSLLQNHAKVVHELLTWPEKLDLKAGNSQVKAWFESVNCWKDSVFQMAKEYADPKIMTALYQFKIKWILSDIKTLSDLNNYFISNNTLSFALQHGYTDSVRLLLTHISTYLDSSPASLSKDEIDVLESILLAKDDDTSGLILACYNGHIQIVEVFFTFIKDFSNSYPEFKESCLKILFYIHDKYGSSLHLSLANNHANVVHELLTWPKKLDLKAGNSQVKAWFESVNFNQLSVFQMAKKYASSMIKELHQFQITWVLSDIPTLSDLNNYFISNNTLSFALQHGYTDSVRLLLSHIDTYINPIYVLQEQDVYALESILLSKDHKKTPGIILACQNGNIAVIKSLFEYIIYLSNRLELREKLLKILFYTDSQHATILQICVTEKHTDILKEILTWPERLELNAEEKIIVCNWFSFINRDGQTILEYTMSEEYCYEHEHSILKSFKLQLDADMKDSIIRKRKNSSSTQNDLIPTQKKERIS